MTGPPTETPTGQRTSAFLSLVAPQLPPALEQISVPCYIVDADGRIRWLNDAAKALVGDVTGKLTTSVIDAGDLPEARTRFARNLRDGGRREFALDVMTREGTSRRVEISAVPLRSQHHAIGMFGMAVPRRRDHQRPPRLDHRLTPRQHDILLELAEGASTEQIAAHLHLSRETVRNHVRDISKRLGTKSRLETVAVARRDEIL